MAVETGKFDPLWNADEWHEYLMHNLTMGDYIKLCGLMVQDVTTIGKDVKTERELKEKLEDRKV